MSKTAANYAELTASLCQIFKDVDENKLPLEKASVLVKTANAITSLQRVKIQSTRVTGERRIKFFED